MRLALVTALGLTTGCLFGSDDQLSVSVNFSIVPLEDSASQPVFQVISSVVQVQHRLRTPSPCFVFNTDATQTSGVIEFVLIATLDQTAGCTGDTTDWSYNALISGIKSGTTRIGITIDDGATRNRTEYTLPSATK